MSEDAEFVSSDVEESAALAVKVITREIAEKNMIKLTNNLRIGAVKSECVILLKKFYWPILSKNQENSKARHYGDRKVPKGSG
jgi:hypothetical protein